MGIGIRNSAKAILIHNGKMLVNKSQNSVGDMFFGLQNGDIYYDLPGGGQNQYETLEEAVKRECLEETGYTVNADRLAAIYEEISVNEQFRLEYGQYSHKVHFIFICSLSGEPVKPVTELDIDMLESVWINVEDIKNIPLYPQKIKAALDLILSSENVLFLGSERV